MKYLFFDVECSNCNHGIGKICEFGYVLTDEKFKILAKDDIPMSPGRGKWAQFDLTGRDGERDLELAYEYDFYYDQQEFPAFYERIKKLMCDKDTICFAYSMGNDLRHVQNTCERYKKEPFDYTCFDVQMMASRYLDQKEQISLEAACRKIVGPSSMVKLEQHLSRDDAMMEMMILQAICELKQKDSVTMLQESSYAKTNSIMFNKDIRNRRQRNQLVKIGNDIYRSSVSPEEDLDLEENKGKRYIASGLLRAHPEEIKLVLSLIKEKDGLVSNLISKADFFIALNDKNKDEIQAHLKYPFEGKFVTYQEFIKK